MNTPTDVSASANVRAISAMLLSQASFVANDALIKLAAAELPFGQAIFLRGVMAFAIALALCHAMGALSLRPLTGHATTLTLRNIGEIGSTFFYLAALFHMPIANTTAILQFMPLAITAAAAIFLREPVGWRRWLATAIGFLGVMIIIQPGGDAFNAWSLVALTGVCFSVLRDLSTRRISTAIPTILLTTISAAVVALAALGFLVVETWHVPSARALMLLAAASFFLLGGYYFIVEAMRLGEVAVVAPFRYSVIVWAIVAGVLIWGEWPSRTALLGTLIVILAGLYTFLRERRLRKLKGQA